ncbi:3-hydroxyacyl-CoA dehydrogenase [Acidisoma cellulosilytica]|uniref:L-gulonate 3-dehydrogenase n=1 Tax=Acidisoma cellulosilyticum TaxID=2802395 RepID=A0A963Z7D2_9PROT|nr:3-hydroxyacyl-CoA dehydrogenase [Acidisoma cellulosilyticum]MCB8883871.1 3-hydroxyacyl-CoA dehydrogenase [Acidisoma cellulosilyticum]
MAKIAIVGAGLIGRAWSIVFARAGHDVWLWDPQASAVSAARDFIAARLPELTAANLLRGESEAAILSRLHGAASLEQVLDGAIYVQENGPEDVLRKRELFARMDKIAAPETILASSTSTIRASLFSEGLPGAQRCLVAHPVNPPYLIPIVELGPSPWTDPAIVQQARALMEAAGMVPAIVKKEIEGFLLNRLQAALLQEAMYLVEEGYADPADIDATVREGLGLRWSFMGPFETIDLNAPDGLADYCARYGGPFRAMMAASKTPSWSKDLIGGLHAAQRERLPADQQSARQTWRDRRLMALLAHKAGQPG